GVVLSVNDNGRGLQKPDAGHDGLGVRIMNYRAETLGGTLVFRRRRGGGTSVACTVPTAVKPSPEKKRHGPKKRG
ncbi:MAG: histidine kinase, partial [Verrucomicrobiales bacterium]